MKEKIISFLKKHPVLIELVWGVFRLLLSFVGLFIKEKPKTALFMSFGGRKYSDSPKAIYDEMCKDAYFDDWNFTWAFKNPEKYEISRGEKVTIDTISFIYKLLSSKVWISNSGMDRGLDLSKKNTIRIETWHGTPLKKICGEENNNAIGLNHKRKIDFNTIRCAQSEYDRTIFSRVFNASKKAILISDLPRNDVLFNYDKDRCERIKKQLGVNLSKKVILYTPTYREYLDNGQNIVFNNGIIDLAKWKSELGDEFVLLFRAHYTVTEMLDLDQKDFIIDVSDYPEINDLYAVADMMISDYSSTFFDYAILDRPMFCFAYDLDEYEKQRGLYLKLDEVLPCCIDKTQDSLLYHIKNINYEDGSKATKMFHKRFAPVAGNATEIIINELKKRL